MPDIEACMAVSTSGKLFENPKLKPEGLETGYDITRTKTSTSPGHSKMLNKKSEPILHPKTINGKKTKTVQRKHQIWGWQSCLNCEF